MTELLLSLGQFITYKRETLGYKKMQFCKMMDVGDDSLRSWERDRFVPTGKNMKNIVTLLKFTNKERIHYFGH